MPYFVYIVRCSDKSLYCGMTNNIEKRIKEHNSSSSRGAKYLRAKKPVYLVYSEGHEDIGSAMRREAEIKKFTKKQKETLVSGSQ